MRSFKGTVWDPVLRRWMKPTAAVIEHRASYRAEKRSLPRRAFDIPMPKKTDEIPEETEAAPTAQRRHAIRRLRDAAESLVAPSYRSPEQKDEDYTDYTRAVHGAIGAGLKNHPIVQLWVQGQRSVRNHEALPKVTRGLGRGRPGEMDKADLWITLFAAALMERDLSFGQIHNKLRSSLRNRDFPGPLFAHEDGSSWLVEGDDECASLKAALHRRLRTKQNLHKRLQRYGLIELEDEAPSTQKFCQPK